MTYREPTRLDLDHEFQEYPVFTQISVNSGSNIALTTNGSVYEWGHMPNPVTMQPISLDRPTHSKHIDISNVVHVTAGHGTKGLVTDTGEAYAWGLNAMGALLQSMVSYNYPLKLPLENIQFMIHGFSHYAAVTYDGQLYTWGQNKHGQLGLGDSKQRIETPGLVPKIDAVVQVSLGIAHTLCLDDKGVTWAFGSGTRYALGIGVKGKASKPRRTKIQSALNVCAAGYSSLALVAS